MYRNQHEIIFLIVIVMAAMVMLPTVRADEKNFSINITSLKEGDVIYGDVIGFPITIYADINSPHGIQEVIITNGINQSSCRADIDQKFFCRNPWKEGKNTIEIIAYDSSGNTVSQTLSYFLVIGQQPPPITVTSTQNTTLPGFEFFLSLCSILITVSAIAIGKRY